MDKDLLLDLTQTLKLLSDAKCFIEGEAALVTAVNNNLSWILKKVQARSFSHKQQLPVSATRVFTQNSPAVLLQASAQHQPLQWEQEPPSKACAAPRSPTTAGAAAVQSGTAAPMNRKIPHHQQQISHPGSRRALSSSAYGQHATAARRTMTSIKQSRTAAAAAIQDSHQQLLDAAAVATAAAAVCNAPLPPAPLATAAPPPVQEEQQQVDNVSKASLPDALPEAFMHLKERYTLLLQQLDSLLPGMGQTQLQQQPNLTGSAAAGFMSKLDQAYGAPSSRAAVQQQHAVASAQRQLTVAQFGGQAEFVALSAAALSAVQVLNKAEADRARSSELQSAVTVLIQQCMLWIAEHSRQPLSTDQQQQQLHNKHDEQLDAAARWRNRCLRSLLCKASAAISDPGIEPESSHNRWQPGELTLWLPQQCRQPLYALQASIAGASATAASMHRSNSNTSSGGSETALEILTPCWQAQQQRIQQHTSASSRITSPSTMTLAPSASITPLVVLCYKDIKDLVQYSRNVQKLQQLLLHLHIESQQAPKLIESVLKGCLACHKNIKGQQGGRKLAQDCCTPERYLALYRLLHFLTAAPAKQRGLSGSCHIAEEETMDADALS